MAIYEIFTGFTIRREIILVENQLATIKNAGMLSWALTKWIYNHKETIFGILPLNTKPLKITMIKISFRPFRTQQFERLKYFMYMKKRSQEIHPIIIKKATPYDVALYAFG